MLKSVIGILISIILFLIGIVISIVEDFSTDTYWIGIIMVSIGLTSTGVFIAGKIKNWF
ncbi:hypothetical protein [Nitrosopumilus sp.]|uniref:hypothetical protein n=1 Tax=Nitrosopumilus sp. TaxID=2024843 RepID=UPI003B5C00BB